MVSCAFRQMIASASGGVADMGEMVGVRCWICK